MIDLEELSMLSNKLAAARKELESLKKSRALLDYRGQQVHAYVSVNDVRIEVDYMDRETGWSSVVKRGHEMIVLGMQKVLNARIDRQLSLVAEIESSIASCAGALAQQAQGQQEGE